jgi:phospholipid-translocating ATPase
VSVNIQSILLAKRPPYSSFFLGIAILQFFSTFSTISPGLVILPLLIVLSISAIKDGYEDIKRHQSDRRVNSTKVRVLSGGDWVNMNFMSKTRKSWWSILIPKTHKGRKLVKDVAMHNMSILENGAPPDVLAGSPQIEFDDGDDSSRSSHIDGDFARPHWKTNVWEDVRVGDFVKIMDNESFPADILICATSEEGNVAYVETKNLDGETNLKSRNAVPALTHLRTAADCASKQNAFHIDCDSPDVNMYKFNATVVKDEEKYPVDLQMTLLRGTVLRNTGWVIGIVLFTGADTKIVLNSGGTPSKRSKVERQTNPQVYVLSILCLG